MSNLKSKISNINTTKSEYEQRIYDFSLRLVKFLKKIPCDTISREIIRQVLRSGTSISANYIEARSASSRKDYINFFSYSLKSANETKFWFDILLDTDLVPEKHVNEGNWLKNETFELSKIIASSIITLKKNESQTV